MCRGLPGKCHYQRKEDGVVVVDRESCLGNVECAMLCKEACPYSAPQFGAEDNAKMQKCGFCLERRAQGKNPICVDACPLRALDAGPLDEMRAKHGESKQASGSPMTKRTGRQLPLSRNFKPSSGPTSPLKTVDPPV